MFWIFATAVLVLAVTVPGFRKTLGYTAAGLVGLLALMWIIGLFIGHA